MISGYNLENLILEEANLSKYFPLLPLYDHGWTLLDNQMKSYQIHPSKYHFCWSKRIASIHSSIKKKQFIVTSSPYIYYAKKNEIKKKKLKNTIFFLSHSMPLINQVLNYELIINCLNRIPEHFKPVDVCLHHNDISLKDKFMKSGFDVVSAGKVWSNEYNIKFFDILSQYSYSMSNTLGSYVLYSLYLDIPFSLIGSEPVYDNFGNDRNVPKKYKLSDNKIAKRYIKLFQNFSDKVTNDQKEMSISELGLNDRVDSSEIKEIITSNFQDAFKSINGFNQIYRFLKRAIYSKTKSIID